MGPVCAAKANRAYSAGTKLTESLQSAYHCYFTNFKANLFSCKFTFNFAILIFINLITSPFIDFFDR